jgi:hypothetical protein
VYRIVSNWIVRKEYVTIHNAILGLECLPVSESCTQHTEHFSSFKSGRKIIDQLVGQPVKLFCSKESVLVQIPNNKFNKKNPVGRDSAGYISTYGEHDSVQHTFNKKELTEKSAFSKLEHCYSTSTIL